MPIDVWDTQDLYLDQRQCQICGKPTYRMGPESGDRERGEKEPLIGNPCLVTLRRELDLREFLDSLEPLVISAPFRA